jgi:hypothetical protein
VPGQPAWGFAKGVTTLIVGWLAMMSGCLGPGGFTAPLPHALGWESWLLIACGLLAVLAIGLAWWDVSRTKRYRLTVDPVEGLQERIGPKLQPWWTWEDLEGGRIIHPEGTLHFRDPRRDRGDRMLLLGERLNVATALALARFVERRWRSEMERMHPASTNPPARDEDTDDEGEHEPS